MSMGMKNSSPPRSVLCGSFRRDKSGVIDAYRELTTVGCQVLSPRRMYWDEAEFVRDEAEANLSIGAIERYHLLAIMQSHFVWLYAPDGYVGLSGAMEIGFAMAHHKPVYSRSAPADATMREFVTVVPSVYDALRRSSLL